MISKNIKFNKSALIKTASELDELFLKYSKLNDDVSSAYKKCKNLIDKAKSGCIIEATNEKLDAAYFSSHFDLINFKDLYEKAAEFDMYLEGWGSEEEYNTYMEKLLSR